MPPTIDYRYRVTFHERDLPGVLDMLRYDAARVLDWSREDHQGRFAVLLSSERAPTVDRWASFALYPVHADTGLRLVR